jgi:hypothetical protein
MQTNTLDPSEAKSNGKLNSEPRHRRGRIAQLPKKIRDQLNQMLLDGKPYAQILQELGPAAQGITVDHLSRWCHGGFLDWQRHHDWLEKATLHWEWATEFVANDHASNIHEASLHIYATQMFEALMSFDRDALSKVLHDKPHEFFRLVTALTRSSHQALAFRKHREAALQANRQIQQMLDPHRELTDSERQAIVDKVDEVLGLKPSRSHTDPPLTTPNRG